MTKMLLLIEKNVHFLASVSNTLAILSIATVSDRIQDGFLLW